MDAIEDTFESWIELSQGLETLPVDGDDDAVTRRVAVRGVASVAVVDEQDPVLREAHGGIPAARMPVQQELATQDEIVMCRLVTNGEEAVLRSDVPLDPEWLQHCPLPIVAGLELCMTTFDQSQHQLAIEPRS